EQLRTRLAPDHGLQLADELRVGSWADARADHVMGRLDVRDPVADRCARRLLERPRPRLDRLHGGTQETHPLDVRRLPAHVLGAHVHHALEPEPRAGGRGRDAVLTGPGLGDDPALPEPPGEDDLTERVVDLVRAGVVQVLALEVDPPAGCEPLNQRDRRRATDVRPAELVQLRAIGGVVLGLLPSGGQLLECGDQRLGDVPAPVLAKGLLQRRQPRAASTYARTRAWSLMPGANSSDEEASTAQGRTAAIASATLSGPRPPARTMRPSAVARLAARCQCVGSSSPQGRSRSRATGSPCRKS